MTLSNTATPMYYKRFRDAVDRGEVPVSREIDLEMSRIEELIADPFYYYDSEAINGFIAFVEDELTLTDGGPVKMLESFKLWAEQVFGWYWFDTISDWSFEQNRMVETRVKRRLTLKQFLIVARGAAKSMYAAFIQAYFLICDTDTTQQITTAPTLKQADEILLPIKTAITVSRGPVFEFLTEGSLFNTTGNRANRVKLASTKKGIESFLTGSLLEPRPMSTDKLQGSRAKICTVDEWLSGDIREDVIGPLEQGASKHPEYLILAISSEGTTRNGAGDTIKLELQRILRGDQYAPHVSIWHYKLDDEEEVQHPELWVKAQPNLNVTVMFDTYKRDVDRMIANPATKNDIMAKRFGIPMEGSTFFFTYEETLLHRTTLNFRHMPCAMGADLSQGDDFCAFTFIFPNGRGGFGVKTRSYITQTTLEKLRGGPRQKYEEFRKEGTLYIMPGTVLEMEDVYDNLYAHIEEMDYDVRTMGYDPWGATRFVELWSRDEGEHFNVRVRQGAQTESVPLGELKKLAEARLLYFDQELMKWTMGNCYVRQDTNGNLKLDKQRREDKIDNVSAMMDAYVAYKANKDLFE